MTAKIVCRMLDAENRLLGWTEHHAAVRGDGRLRAEGPVAIEVEANGAPLSISMHWADVNVEARVPCAVPFVKKGDTVTIFPHGAAMIVLGEPPVGLPAVTVGRPVAIGFPVGQMGARG